MPRFGVFEFVAFLGLGSLVLIGMYSVFTPIDRSNVTNVEAGFIFASPKLTESEKIQRKIEDKEKLAIREENIAKSNANRESESEGDIRRGTGNTRNTGRDGREGTIISASTGPADLNNAPHLQVTVIDYYRLYYLCIHVPRLTVRHLNSSSRKHH